VTCSISLACTMKDLQNVNKFCFIPFKETFPMYCSSLDVHNLSYNGHKVRLAAEDIVFFLNKGGEPELHVRQTQNPN
jgi:hypothetical protein